MLNAAPPADWRRRAVIYQIYPKSFRDADGDGVGDLQGVIEKLDHIAALGADCVWLSPIFASPMIDNGYDTSDYCAVNPLFGTLEDVDALVAEARQRGLRIILDIALNHSSTAHPWFQAALADPHSPYADYYFWREAPAEGAPNNWRSVFGGPAWTQPEGDSRAYLHLFDKAQADLNWDHPPVRQEIYRALRFWLDRGIGGFRLDVVTLISKPDGLPDMPVLPLLERYKLWAQGPRLHDYLREMHREVFAHYDCLAIGEGPGLTPSHAAALVDPADPMLDMIYHFDLVEPPQGPDGSLDHAAFKQVFMAWDQGIGPRGWNSTVLSNHDLGRIVSRFGDDAAHQNASAKMLLALVLLMRGTPFLYQGDELGLVNAAFTSIDQLDDIWAKNLYALEKAKGADDEAALAVALTVTRDHARTPFPWGPGAHLGFCADAATPWLCANPRHAALTAAAQRDDPQSPFAFAQALIALRRANPVWTQGDLVIRPEPEPAAFVFARRLGADVGVVALNLSAKPVALAQPLPDTPPVLTNAGPTAPPGQLGPYAAQIYRLE